jgi:hypothetical protein
VITIEDARNSYLVASAFTKQEFSTLLDKWNEPVIKSVQEAILKYIRSDPKLEAFARQDPAVRAMLDGG